MVRMPLGRPVTVAPYGRHLDSVATSFLPPTEFPFYRPVRRCWSGPRALAATQWRLLLPSVLWISNGDRSSHRGDGAAPPAAQLVHAARCRKGTIANWRACKKRPPATVSHRG